MSSISLSDCSFHTSNKLLLGANNAGSFAELGLFSRGLYVQKQLFLVSDKIYDLCLCVGVCVCVLYCGKPVKHHSMKCLRS